MVVCFEGVDASGKSTQANLLADYLERSGRKVIVVEHPGFTPFGEGIRELLLHGPQARADLASRLLFWADHLETANALREMGKGSYVILDRHPRYSNRAYGITAGTTAAVLEDLERSLGGSMIAPDLTLVLDVSIEEVMKRFKARGVELDLIERRAVQHFEKIRYVYQQLASRYPEVVVIDANAEMMEVFKKVLKVLRGIGVEVGA